jgi:hypothetical protein
VGQSLGEDAPMLPLCAPLASPLSKLRLRLCRDLEDAELNRPHVQTIGLIGRMPKRKGLAELVRWSD